MTITRPRIAGLDLSLASTGYATPTGELLTFATKPPANGDDRGRRLHQHLELLERALRCFPPMPALVLVEGYAFHAPGPLGLTRLAELGGAVRLRLFEHGIRTIEVAPASLKRYATGNGNATKEAMVAAAEWLGAKPANDDEADAFLLRHLARTAYGLEAETTPNATEVVAGIVWPVL